MLIISLSILSLIYTLDINYISQYSSIDLKSLYISSLDLYGFRLKNNETGNIILQPFQNIDYFYLCVDEYQLSNPENYCTKKTKIKANTDNNLGVYPTSITSIIFLFHEELQMKLFFDQSIFKINIDNDLYYKCFDFFSGYNKLTFNLNSDLNYNTTINIQLFTNISTNIKATLVDRNSQKEYLILNAQKINYFYTLSHEIDYSLYYSQPIGNDVHSMICMTFSDYEEYFFATYTHKIPIIFNGTYKFYSFLEKEWNVSSEYYPTTFYFYLNESKYINCTYTEIKNNSRNKNYCSLKQNEDINYLYSTKIYSHRDSYLLFELFFEPDLIDENCHFGKNLIFNKTATEYDPYEHYIEVLKEVLTYLIVIMTLIIISVSCIVFCPLLYGKCRK